MRGHATNLETMKYNKENLLLDFEQLDHAFDPPLNVKRSQRGFGDYCMVFLLLLLIAFDKFLEE